MGEISVDSHHQPNNLDKLDLKQASTLYCPLECSLDWRNNSYGRKLALRASLRYTGEDDQWQINHSSLRDRNKYMFNRELFSDVRFLVGRADKTSIPAHRYILAISSPVFSSLFYAFGALQLEQTTREQIEVSECEPDAFLEMLRYMYYDEVRLTTLNVPEVLFLAQKYLIPNLAKICTEFVGNNLTVENTLPVLDHCFLLGVSKGLEKQCWSIIDKHASEVAEHNQFLDIDHGTLTVLLSRDTLVAKEMVLFRAAVKWAGHECQRLSIPLTVENKRKVLGDAFYSIRFPLMSMKEFTDEVAQSSFLSHEEVADMYIGFNSSFESCKVKFRTEPRAKPAHDLFQEPALRCPRFEPNALGPKLSAEALAQQSTDSSFESCNVKFPTEPRVKPANHQLQEPAHRCSRFESNSLRPKLSTEALAQESTVKFKVNRSIRITGVALFTTFTNTSRLFQIELRDKNGSLLMSHSADLTNRGSESEIHDIFFTKGVKLERDVVYSISVVSGDLPVRYGKGPIKEVTCGGVKFDFLDPVSDHEKEKDQIPELLFKPLEEGTLV